MHVARGSLAEVETQIQIARRLSYLHADGALDELVDRVFAKLGALLNSLKAREDA
ncbi:MAG: four helix bundle protein [Gammaproteobacteria bacterium]